LSKDSLALQIFGSKTKNFAIPFVNAALHARTDEIVRRAATFANLKGLL